MAIIHVTINFLVLRVAMFNSNSLFSITSLLSTRSSLWSNHYKINIIITADEKYQDQPYCQWFRRSCIDNTNIY